MQSPRAAAGVAIGVICAASLPAGGEVELSEDVLGLAGRWASALDYFGRDFPHDALRADPERLAYARKWLRERNAELSTQSDELVARLPAANDGFRGGAGAERLAAAREALEGVRTQGPSARRRSSAIAIASSS